ncbi:TerB family tellurite resistance protein [Reichenbachiella agarivorans]|uniref:TerB family tellurite resistance protein n=1 Tax=Reichenbachiella agarivorans TaxID=2979464 RepID=A0ABY6CRL2_9BACT|nr:TerB family tellurite resistance protein [Reichenbachiella agarivorans]UXP33156.1 TerB family tellurite resistance protein [Reichenbachiella agarivorans]
MNFKAQMSVLVQLALIDNKLSNIEKRYVYALGKANGIPERELDAMFDELMGSKKLVLPDLGLLSEDEKFEYLYNIVQLMKVDKRVYLSEIRFCQKLATKLGYKASVVSELSSGIFSDPDVTGDRDHLKAMIQKHKTT